jgi:hypothetical protein
MNQGVGVQWWRSDTVAAILKTNICLSALAICLLTRSVWGNIWLRGWPWDSCGIHEFANRWPIFEGNGEKPPYGYIINRSSNEPNRQMVDERHTISKLVVVLPQTAFGRLLCLENDLASDPWSRGENNAAEDFPQRHHCHFYIFCGCPGGKVRGLHHIWSSGSSNRKPG